MKQSKSRRRRGIVLTPVGLKRLQAAILAVEKAHNNGDRFTLDELGLRMNVSSKTLSRLWSLDRGVDQKTVKLCFSAFNLELCSEDYTILDEPNQAETSGELLVSLDTQEVSSCESLSEDSFNEQRDKLKHFWSYPDGPVPLDSPFYIERPPIEELVYREVTQPGCVIRIRAPRQMGKSSLVLRLCAFAQNQGYRTVNLNCYQIDSDSDGLTDLSQVLRNFCWRIATELDIDPNLNDIWDEEVGCKLNCSFYLHYLLKQIQSPVVLVLNEIDRFFEHPHIAQEFFALLRSWCEEARQNVDWQKLRLVVVYSTEEYATLDINRSPFNIGLPICLVEFTQQQVEDLAHRHGLDWSTGKESAQLISFVGGHPALIRIALYYLCSQVITLEELIQEAVANGGIYRYNLWRHWAKLQEKPSLAKTYTDVVTAKQGISLDPIDVYKLDSLGLIRFEGDRIFPRCELYRAYFAKQLATII
ncbi:AAA-like domain-containing protein [Scytonema sp. PCC 10023]|uniref:AAA-like domain-containing protein n=1 Tax=Scytonema sp. PCC 10023 TaxID=1680591 RepID=UPI0039C71B0E